MFFLPISFSLSTPVVQYSRRVSSPAFKSIPIWSTKHQMTLLTLGLKVHTHHPSPSTPRATLPETYFLHTWKNKNKKTNKQTTTNKHKTLTCSTTFCYSTNSTSKDCQLKLGSSTAKKNHSWPWTSKFDPVQLPQNINRKKPACQYKSHASHQPDIHTRCQEASLSPDRRAWQCSWQQYDAAVWQWCCSTLLSLRNGPGCTVVPVWFSLNLSTPGWWSPGCSQWLKSPAKMNQ